MTRDNLQRMIELAGDFFATKNDPSQISVTSDIMEKLRQIHPGTLMEENDGNGPIAWVLVIPTNHGVMEQFIARNISEKELLEATPVHGKYDALYLCSALVLPEHREKGLAKRLLVTSVRSIMRDHPIKDLFYWAFSPEGERLANSVGRECGLPLHKRPG